MVHTDTCFLHHGIKPFLPNVVDHRNGFINMIPPLLHMPPFCVLPPLFLFKLLLFYVVSDDIISMVCFYCFLGLDGWMDGYIVNAAVTGIQQLTQYFSLSMQTVEQQQELHHLNLNCNTVTTVSFHISCLIVI
jgi:hypothetical protein